MTTATFEQVKDITCVRLLIEIGREKGFLTQEDVNTLAREELDSDQIEMIYQLIEDEGIEIVEKLKDLPHALDSDLLVSPLEKTAELVEEELAVVEGLQVDDSVRMWLREIGKTPLLSLDREVDLAKRI